MAVVATLFLGLFFSGPSTEDVNRAVKQVFGDERLQSEFPDREAPQSDPGPDLPDLYAPWLEVVLWVVVGAAVLIALVALVRRFGGYTAPVREKEAQAAAAAAEDGFPFRVADAETAASEGRYEDAIHVLLLIALHRIALLDPVPQSLTSREVLARGSLGEDARPALGLLVRTVEASLFGSRPAGAEEWQACRVAYDEVATVLDRSRT